MKVVYILEQFPVVSETFILNEIIEMQHKGVDIEILSIAKPAHEITHAQIREVKNVVYINEVSKLHKLAAHFVFFKRPGKYLKTFFLFLRSEMGNVKIFFSHMHLISHFEKSRPNHIHAHFGLKAADIAMFTHLMTGIPFSFTTHRYDIFDYPPSNYKLKSTYAKKHITISNFNKEYLIQEFDIHKDKIEVIHCGVDFSRHFPERIASADNVIISIARLEKLKALENLITACAHCKKENIYFKCLIIGEGSERKMLENLIDQLNLKNEVVLLGSKSQDEVFALLAQSTIMVLPSRSEGISVSLMEAMAMKIPVIATSINGTPELIQDGVNGYLVPPDNIEDLSDRIERLLKDENLRRTFSEKAYLKVYHDFNLRTETDKLLAIWKAN